MKKILLIGAIISISAISFAFMKKDKPKFENLKVLPKNTDKQQMDSIMKHFSLSLGVRCTFCHVRSNDEQKNFNFASDDNKHKLVAREMIKMTAKINKKYFKEDHENANLIPTVTCFTCHNGHEEPSNIPPAPPSKK